MADEPTSTTIPETVTVETGADKESIESLNANFEDFWKEEDSKAGDTAPAAPGAEQETKEPKAEPRETPEPKPETLPKEYSDDEIDRFALTKSERPEAIENFAQLKAGWKAERARVKAESERATRLEQELAQARQNSWTPEQKADYEHAASIRRKFDFASDPDFQAKFHAPIREKYHDLLNEAVEFLPDRAQAIEWAKHLAANWSPDQLDKNWWNKSVIEKVPDETDQATLRQSVANLLKMQRERDAEIFRRTNDKSAYDNWVKERDLARSQWEVKEVMEEIGIQEQKLKDILRKDPAEAKTKEEREAIEKHNERFEKYNGYFQEVMKDLTFNGPRARVRAAVGATKAEYIEGELYKEMEKRAKSAEAERDQYKAELDKITSARRKIAHTTGTPPTTSGKDKNGGLSISNLDVRKSFESFDWGDGTK